MNRCAHGPDAESVESSESDLVSIASGQVCDSVCYVRASGNGVVQSQMSNIVELEDGEYGNDTSAEEIDFDNEEGSYITALQ